MIDREKVEADLDRFVRNLHMEADALLRTRYASTDPVGDYIKLRDAAIQRDSSTVSHGTNLTGTNSHGHDYLHFRLCRVSGDHAELHGHDHRQWHHRGSGQDRRPDRIAGTGVPGGLQQSTDRVSEAGNFYRSLRAVLWANHHSGYPGHSE